MLIVEVRADGLRPLILQKLLKVGMRYVGQAARSEQHEHEAHALAYSPSPDHDHLCTPSA